MENDLRSERYHRQMVLKELGESGQQRLTRARVLVVGAGGLGCPVLQYLAAAGVGTIGIVDHDRVSLSNLHRQVIYTNADVGHLKVSRAASRLAEMNPGVRVDVYPDLLTTKNALEILEKYDVIVDATDNFPARYLISDACVLLGRPFVQGAVSRYEGQLAVFNCQTDPDQRPVSYRDVFPVPPPDGAVENCAEAGVLGVLPGIIGSMQAAEVIKLLTGIGEPLTGRLQTYNMLRNEWFTWEIQPDPRAEGMIPRTDAAFRQTVYDSASPAGGFTEIDPVLFDRLCNEEHVTVVDVRKYGELPPIDAFPHRQIPLGALQDQLDALNSSILIAVCQSGQRSRLAARLLADTFSNKTIYSLRGGIAAWKQHFQSYE